MGGFGKKLCALAKIGFDKEGGISDTHLLYNGNGGVVNKLVTNTCIVSYSEVTRPWRILLSLLD